MDRLRPEVFALIVADPRHKRIDIGVGRHIGRHHPERRVKAGVIAIQRLVETQPLIVELGCRGDDGGTAGEKLGHHRCRDGTLGRTGDDRDFIGIATSAGVFRPGRDPGVELRVNQSALCQSAATPPVSLGGDNMAGTLESLGQRRPIRVDVVLISQPQLHQILTGTRPAIVEQHRFAGIESRGDQPWPIRTEFTGDEINQFGVGRCRQCGDRVVQTELPEHQPGGRGQHATGTGHGCGELIQRGRIDDTRTSSAAGRWQRHGDTVPGRDRGDCTVDGLIDGTAVR